MALAPQFATHRIGSPSAPHTLELFLDLICPFSQKLLLGVRSHVLPLPQSSNLQIIIRQNPQPWHASSTLVHESVLAVGKVLAEEHGGVRGYGEKQVREGFLKFFFEVMDGQKAFYDEPTSKESPNATRGRLADLASQTLGIDRDKVLAAFTVGRSNGGTPVTNDLKLQIKYGRQTGVHVTPTVAFDGLIDNSVSSSFSEEEWKKYIEEKVV